MAAISLAQRFNPRFGGACTMKYLVGHGDFHRSYPLDIWFLQQRAALCAATNDDGVAFGRKIHVSCYAYSLIEVHVEQGIKAVGTTGKQCATVGLDELPPDVFD